jgi:hypothetical protein
MAKKLASKTETPTTTSLVVNEIRTVQARRGNKDIQSFKNSLQSAESVFNPQRILLYDMYDDVVLDGHLTGIIGKRTDALLNKHIYFQNAKGERMPEMNHLIESLAFRECLKKRFESIFYGISGIEFVPGAVFSWKEINRKHIIPSTTQIVFDQYAMTGIDYSTLDNVLVTGNEKDLGLLLKCSPYIIYKQGNWGDWSQYIEIFGQPVRVIYYDTYDNRTKMELKQVLEDSGSSLAMMIPKQAQFELKDGKQSNGDGKLQESFKNSLNQELSIIILGQTETTTSSSSSGYAQSKTHSDQQFEITKNDMAILKSWLNEEKFLNVLASYGYPVQGGKFVFEKEYDLDKLKVRLDIDNVVATKVVIEPEYWYETYGIPIPKTGAEKAETPSVNNTNPNQKTTKNNTKPNQLAIEKPDETNPRRVSNHTRVKLSAFEKFKHRLFRFFFHAPLK